LNVYYEKLGLALGTLFGLPADGSFKIINGMGKTAADFEEGEFDMMYDKLLRAGGVTTDRLKGEGFGEIRLINKCANGVRCSAKEHEFNRRSEFIILE